MLRYFLLPVNGPAFTVGADDYAHPINANTFQWGAGGNILEGFVPTQDCQVDIVPVVRGAYAAIFPRFNNVERVRFTVSREFSSYELADAFKTFHGKFFPVSGELMKVEISPTGTTMSYLKNAVTARRPQCILDEGVHVKYTYEFCAANGWQNTP